MPTYEERGNKNYRVIATRFRSKSDLDDFAVHIGLTPGTLTNLTTEVTFPELNIRNKRPAKTKRSNTGNTNASTFTGMPYFINEENKPYVMVKLYFDEELYSPDDISELMEQKITDSTKSAWYPVLDTKGKAGCLRIIGGETETHFPVYIVSKGRHDVCITSYFLTLSEVKHYVVVEEFEYEKYLSTVGQSPFTTVITIPQRFFDEYDTLCDYENDEGEVRKTGPGAARNFAIWHSIQNGAKACHLLDDNLHGMYMLNENLRMKVRTPAMIRAMEEHFMAFDNVALAGPNYRSFASPDAKRPSHIFNTRIYSWIIFRNDLYEKGFKFRGRYNEDTILSLDVLTAGYATAQWNMFLQHKMGTQGLKGGNTEEFYNEEGTLRKSQMLVDTYPQYAKLVWKFQRYHHTVDYSPFANNDPQFHPERLKDGYNDFGMYIVKITPEEDHNKNQQADTKTELERNHPRSEAVYLFDGTRWQGDFDLIKDFKEKGY